MTSSKPPTDRQISDVSALFGIIADPNRLKILLALGEAGELNVGEIRDRLGWNHSRTSFRLMKMRSRGLVIDRKEGLTRRYSLTGKGLVVVAAARTLFRLA